MAFIDLSTAYDTVNHNIMLSKLYKITKDYNFVKIIETLPTQQPTVLRNPQWKIQRFQSLQS